MLTPYDILKGFNCLDSEKIQACGEFLGYIEGQEKHKPKHKKKFVTVLIAAVLILSMSVTAFAYFGDSEWFKSFFTARNKDELSDSQMQYIEKNVVGVGENAVCGDWTVTVESALCDKYHAYIKLNIDAPQGTEFKEGVYSFEDVSFGKIRQNIDEKIASYGYSFSIANNEESSENILSLLFESVITVEELNNFSYTDGEERELCLKNFSFINENVEKQILAEGEWKFRFILKPANEETVEEIEFVTEPVSTFGKGLQRDTVNARLLSCRVTAIGATCTLDFPSNEIPEAIELQGVKIYMKNGKCIEPLPGACGLNYYTKVCSLKLDFEAPILLEEIDYIEFPDNVQLYGYANKN